MWDEVWNCYCCGTCVTASEECFARHDYCRKILKTLLLRTKFLKVKLLCDFSCDNSSQLLFLTKVEVFWCARLGARARVCVCVCVCMCVFSFFVTVVSVVLFGFFISVLQIKFAFDVLYNSHIYMASFDQVWSWDYILVVCLFGCCSIACGCRDLGGRNNLCRKSHICVWSLVC